jgi:hypothetical protein
MKPMGEPISEAGGERRAIVYFVDGAPKGEGGKVRSLVGIGAMIVGRLD